MPTLYIANTTKQPSDFVYRLPEETSIRRQKIEAGGQQLIYAKDATMQQISAIIEHHLIYGLTDVTKIDQRKPFIGLCYSIDKPINVEKIMYVDEHNIDVQNNVSAEERQTTAAAIQASLNNATRGAGRVENLELEVVEQNSDDQPGLNEVVVIGEGAPSEAPRRRRRR